LNDRLNARLAEGFARRRLHDTEGAYVAIADAAALEPGDPQVALALAQISYETWRPAAALFARARELDPQNQGIARGAALALNAEGQHDEAQALLQAVLGAHPDWIEGHKTLATIRATGGSGEPFDASFVAAAKARPDDLPLHMAWFHALAGARDWHGARVALEKTAARFGLTRGVRLGKAFLASESDEASRDPAIFAGLDDVNDPGLDLARIRFWLRTGAPATAAAIAESRIGGPLAHMFWPYLSLAWRLTDDTFAATLDEERALISTIDLNISDNHLAHLETTLRQLFVLTSPYHEQSVRGGVQTNRHLFFNPDPVIQHIRAHFMDAVRHYIDILPAPTTKRPLLGLPRAAPFVFDGSWSVLLRGQGFHAPHTHVKGCISSAFYVTVPPAIGTQGWLAFGSPPPELGLDLAPLHCIEPKPGRLVLFPSTHWHDTLPFENGERLTIAFDVAGSP
jgi:tetratricopeptide (TPR) repeat protein